MWQAWVSRKKGDKQERSLVSVVRERRCKAGQHALGDV